MRQRIPAAITHVYGHQEDAIRAIRSGRTTLVSTGTGSGKTECFLYPIVSKCLELRDADAPAGISAVIVYPMNALAEDQLGRLRSLLAGTRHPVRHVRGQDARAGERGRRHPACRWDRRAPTTRRRSRRCVSEKRSETVYPPEEVCSREVMRTRGKQPRILLTNVKQLELLLTRQRDVELFADARLDFLVFDEAHTFTGAQGAETACLIRRLRSLLRTRTPRTPSASPRRRRSLTSDTRMRPASSRRGSSASPRTASRPSARRTSRRYGTAVATVPPARRRRTRRRC